MDITNLGKRFSHILNQGTSWNRLELAETTWNERKQAGTTWNEMQRNTTNLHKTRESHRRILYVQYHCPTEHNISNSFCHKELLLGCWQESRIMLCLL